MLHLRKNLYCPSVEKFIQTFRVSSVFARYVKLSVSAYFELERLLIECHGRGLDIFPCVLKPTFPVDGGFTATKCIHVTSNQASNDGCLCLFLKLLSDQ